MRQKLIHSFEGNFVLPLWICLKKKEHRKSYMSVLHQFSFLINYFFVLRKIIKNQNKNGSMKLVDPFERNCILPFLILLWKRRITFDIHLFFAHDPHLPKKNTKKWTSLFSTKLTMEDKFLVELSSSQNPVHFFSILSQILSFTKRKVNKEACPLLFKAL